MKSKSKIKHPNKVGVVGPKLKDANDKKEPIRIYREKKYINQLGGIEEVKNMLSNYFDLLLKQI